MGSIDFLGLPFSGRLSFPAPNKEGVFGKRSGREPSENLTSGLLRTLFTAAEKTSPEKRSHLPQAYIIDTWYYLAKMSGDMSSNTTQTLSRVQGQVFHTKT